ncbi:FAD:protein FMN transferase [Imhoffiella purpurea]|uniref:FAD:protein FMN transferase n=1 Tax=Imhoffiella purpurea TaxID=1249627 RepID=W9V9A8_9GAMM|nr:FAD:protein FMN transferase [Imhoffiella purpurea]EXJ16029.1 ApbE-like lipoprotein [Imhoffiella purpurea]
MQHPSSASIQIPTRGAILTSVLLFLALTASACRERSPVIITQFTAFDTQVDVSLVGVSKDQAKQASSLIARDFAYLENEWGASETGRMVRVNRLLQTQIPFVPPPSLLELIRRSQDLETRSDGLFNPAIGKLIRLWGFESVRPDSHPPPSDTEIARLVEANPRMSEIEIDGLEITGRNPELDLDFTAFAKGTAIDMAIERLEDLGVRNALIQAGGALRAIGDRSGQPWRIPVRRASGSGVFAILAIQGDESVVTVAEYDRNFLYEGTLYHAIVDPRTGRPADRMRTVTVVHPSTATATAAATALFIAGPTQWCGIAERMGVDQALLIDREGRVHLTPALDARIQWVEDRDNIDLVDPKQMTTADPGEAGI